MIKLTDFNAVVDTYKKNFLIRKKRFKNTQAQASVEKRAKRENRIEIGKFAKRVGGGFAKKFKPAGGGDFLNDLLRFAGFTVLGLIVANIEKISIALKNTIEKIKEVANNLRIFYEEKVKPFFETVYNSAKSAYVAISGISNFFIDVNPLREFSDLLDTVIYGILATGYKMGSLNEPKAPKPPKPPAKTPTKKLLSRHLLKFLSRHYLEPLLRQLLLPEPLQKPLHHQYHLLLQEEAQEQVQALEFQKLQLPLECFPMIY